MHRGPSHSTLLLRPFSDTRAIEEAVGPCVDGYCGYGLRGGGMVHQESQKQAEQPTRGKAWMAQALTEKRWNSTAIIAEV